MTRDHAAPELAEQAAAAVPVTVLTGFLGAGKTTVLNHLLGHAGMDETAVLINEFGEVGLDHLLVREVVSEDVVLLNAGCLCCTVRGELVTALRDMMLRRIRGEVPEFKRLMIETTGLADPAPILHTLMRDPFIGAHYRLDGVVTVVDAVNGQTQLDAHQEAVKQAAVADRLVMSKTDLAEAHAVEALKRRLRALNPTAGLIEAGTGDIHPDALFGAGLFRPETRIPDVAAWLRAEALATPHAESGHDHAHHHDVNRHDSRISAFCLTWETPVDAPSFFDALGLLIAMKGQDILRLKGIVMTEQHAGPLAVHGVQHLFHPPVELPSHTFGDPGVTRLVFITRDLPRLEVEKFMEASFP